MSLTQTLTEALESGIDQIGQIRILRDPLRLHHLDETDVASLEIHTDPEDAREISTYAEDGTYRFTKGERSLRRGWLFELDSIEDLRRTLDHFYPASLGLWDAWKSDRIRVQNLREKLNRQSGMYRHARNVSDQGAQELVREVCGPDNKCVKKILWQLDQEIPLEDSEASRFDGILAGASATRAIPMVCQEACNFFVAEARKKARVEFEENPD